MSELREEGARPEVVLDGKTYRLRRLTVADGFRLLRLLSSGIGATILSGQAPALRQATPEGVLGFLAGALLAALPNAEREVIEFLGSLVGMKGDEFAQLPMGSELEVVRALLEAPELPQVALALIRLVSSKAPWEVQQAA